MEPFRPLDAIAAPMAVANIDTDQILPARFLPKLRAEGLGPCLFRDLRFEGDGSERPDFILNRPPYREATILVTGRNFGCGSSREAAVYALYDYGLRAVVAPSFGDIFHANCLKNGLLPVALPDDTVTELLTAVEEWPGARLRIDLADQTLTAPDGETHAFAIDGMRKHMLLNGIDEIDYTLGLAAEIDAFERRRDAIVGAGRP
jgi:3-isopropylmalate/(R)-2-methylmalate dehydratase small subunit